MEILKDYFWLDSKKTPKTVKFFNFLHRLKLSTSAIYHVSFNTKESAPKTILKRTKLYTCNFNEISKIELKNRFYLSSF